jgi:hypothetical protein
MVFLLLPVYSPTPGVNKIPLVIHKEVLGFEILSDYSGVLFVPYDSAGNWWFELAKELRASGHTIDANRLLC